MKSFAGVALRLVLCAAVSYAVWRWLGLAMAMLTVPLYGIALAKPLLELASTLRHQTRALVWGADEGRHYAFHGTRVRVIEDDDHVRWVCAADVRKIVGFTASDGALALTYPDGWRRFGRPPQPYFSDSALLTHLRKENSAEALRLLHWVERTIAYPARHLRERQRG